MAQDVENDRAGGPMDRLKDEARGLVSALGDRAMASVRDRVEGTTGRLTDYVEGGAGPGLMAAVTGAKDVAEGKGPVKSALHAGAKGITEKVKGLFGKGGGKGGGKKLKVTNIVESIDVGVPIDLAYNQWTQFNDLPSFMKKLEDADQDDNEPQKSHWKAQVFWSHREWESEVVEQIPDERIIWKSKGQKGHVDGAVTFHKLAPSLTRILVVLEYYPQGLFEHTGNLWRAQGRRVRLELKHFRRHVMINTILHGDEVEGWRGVIEDGEVVQDHEEALSEQQQGDDQAEDRADGGEPEDEAYADDQAEPEDDQAEPEDDRAEPEDSASEDEYQDAEDEEEQASPNGRSAERPVRRTEGARRRSAGGQRSGRPARTGDRPQRPVRRRAATRGES